MPTDLHDISEFKLSMITVSAKNKLERCMAVNLVWTIIVVFSMLKTNLDKILS